jgi:hypothetical protein
VVHSDYPSKVSERWLLSAKLQHLKPSTPLPCIVHSEMASFLVFKILGQFGRFHRRLLPFEFYETPQNHDHDVLQVLSFELILHLPPTHVKSLSLTRK